MSSATIRPLGPDPATVARSILRSAASRRANGVTLIPFDSAAGPKLCSGVCTALKGSSALLTATGALTTGAGADAGEAATGAKAGFTADLAAGDDAATSPGASMTATTAPTGTTCPTGTRISRSEEHTSELQSLMRISYAVFCLK